MTSNRICRVGEFDNSHFLKAHCSCLDDDHIHTMNVDYDTDLDIVDLVIYHKAFTPYKDNFHCKGFWEHLEYWYKDKVTRLKWILKIIFHGYVEVEASFEFHGVEQINEYLTAIANSRDKILYHHKKLNTSSQFEQEASLQVEQSIVE